MERDLRSVGGALRGDGLVLAALERGLAAPCVLLDRQGRLLWANHEAQLRFEMDALRLGSSRILHPSSGALSLLRELARRAAQSPQAALTLEGRVAAGWLLPGERLLVRQVQLAQGPGPVILVLFTPGPTRDSATVAPEVLTRLGLTAREAEIAALCGQAYSIVNIAARLGIAEATVRTHLRATYRKLAVASRSELVVKVLGLVSREALAETTKA